MADYNWQISAVKRFTYEVIAAIVAACGTGKTRAYIKLAIAKGMPTIIIAPRNICKQIESDIYEIAGKDQEVWRYDRKTETAMKGSYEEKFIEWLGKTEDGHA